MRKFFAVFASLTLAVAMMSGCGNTKGEVKSIKIGVTVYDQYDVFIGQLVDEINEYAKVKSNETGVNISIETYNAATNQLTQNSQVQDMIDGGCDIICVNLVDRTAPSSVIDMAEDSDTPIIFFNRELVEEDLLRWDKLYYVGAKAFESGVMEGELAVDYIRNNPDIDRDGDGIISYMVFEGEAGHQDAIVRTEYCINTLEENGIPIKKAGGVIANWNRDQAKAKMAQFLDQGLDVELIMSNNDAMALGAIDAYDAADIPVKDRPAIFGIDGVDEGLRAVADGTLQATVYNDGVGQAKKMLDLAFQIMTGGDLTEVGLEDGKYIRLPYMKVTKENYEDYIK